MALLMSCRKAVRLHSESLDRKLTRLERLGLWLHMLVCRACARYSRQIKFVRTAIKRYVRRQEDGLGQEPVSLSPSAAARMKAAIAKQKNAS